MLCETPVYVCRERACRTIGQYTRDLHDGHKSVNLLYVCETHLCATPLYFYDFSHVIQGPWERKEGA